VTTIPSVLDDGSTRSRRSGRIPGLSRPRAAESTGPDGVGAGHPNEVSAQNPVLLRVK